MKIDEIVKGLLEIRSQYGNLEVGIYNKEMGCFDSCKNVFVKNSSLIEFPQLSSMLSDDDELGNEFAAID